LIAKELLSHAIVPLQTSDTGELAVQMMQVNHVRHFPIVNHEKLLGVISEEDTLIHELDEPIGTYRLSYLRPYCFDDEHIFDVMSRLSKLQLSLIPVIDREENYLGVVTLERLLQYFADNFSFSEIGSIVIIESIKNDYSMSEILRLAESEDTKVLSFFVNKVDTTNLVRITVKLNRQDISGFKSALERYGYDVMATFSEHSQVDGLKDRYDSLMSYLNV